MPRVKKLVDPLVEDFLDIWAYWRKRAEIDGLLGLSSSIGLIMRDIPPDFKSSKVSEAKLPEYYFNELADHIEFMLKHTLMKENPKAAKALIICKVWSEERRKKYIKDKSIGRQTLYDRAFTAKLWLSDKLTKDPFFEAYL